MVKCVQCQHDRATVAGRPCFFCESGERISSFQAEQSARHASYSKTHSAHAVKKMDRHSILKTRGGMGRR